MSGPYANIIARDAARIKELEARIKELEAQLAKVQQTIGYVQALFDVHPYGQTINIEATHWMPLPDMPKEGET
jgi:prefoldin subunit 5